MESKPEKEYWSIESTPKDYRYSKFDMVPAGRIEGSSGDRIYLLYDAPDGLGWYETKIRVGGRWVSQEVATFGREIKKRPA